MFFFESLHRKGIYSQMNIARSFELFPYRPHKIEVPFYGSELWVIHYTKSFFTPLYTVYI